MVGETVVHVRFGGGTVVAFEPPKIRIAFQNGDEKNFIYPQAVGKFIRFDRDEIQRQAEQDWAQSDAAIRELEAAKRMEMRRQADEANRLRAEAMREKKLIAARRTAAMRRTKTGGVRK